MSKLLNILNIILSLCILTGCSFQIPPGHYTTTNGPSFAGRNLILTENGRFQYRSWSDDAPATLGHGAYVIVGNYLLLVFENGKIQESKYSIKEKTCTEQDSQLVNFHVSQTNGEPLLFVCIHNKNDDHSQHTMTLLEGEAQLKTAKNSGKKVFKTHSGWYEDIEIEFDGDKCYDIDVTLKDEMNRLQRGHAIAALLKREGDQLFIKMPYWTRKYSKIYLRE